MLIRNNYPIIHGMLGRMIRDKLLNTVEQRPAVVLTGARQVGKTTLARTISEQINSVYIDLQSPSDMLRLKDPLSFFLRHYDKLIILDEIQYTPEVFSILRGVIDNNRWEGRRAGQFLLLGSASMNLLKQTAESLAGRVSYVELYGLNILEVDKTTTAQQRRWLRGGFPESYLANSDESSMNWLEDLVMTYLERDIPQLALRAPAIRLHRLWTMLSHLQGETLNCSKLASNLSVDAKTIASYIDALVDLLLVRRLMPWHENTKKRVTKSPRYYIRDSGILHQLQSIYDYDALISHPVLGKSWEGFVIENIQSILPRRAKTYFFQASTGAEIDLVIRFSHNKIWAIEIKFGIAPKVSKIFSQTADEIGATSKFVVYGGDDEFSIGNSVTMISLPAMMHRLQKESSSA